MSVLLKLVLLSLSFIMALTHYEYGNVMCMSIAICSFLFISYDLFRMYKMFMNFSVNYHDSNKSTSTLLNAYERHDYIGKNDDYCPTYTRVSHSVNNKRVDAIKMIEDSMSAKKKNFIDFVGDKKKISYTSNFKQKEEKKNKPTRNSKFDGGEVLMINNSEHVDGVDKLVYDAIIEVIDSETLKPNERYAILQSFYHIDVIPMMINIYVDKFILSKARLDETYLNKDKIIKKIQEKLKNENIVIIFSELKAVNLLNYYLKL